MEFEMKKKFGQNFLRDKNLLAAIVCDAGITKDDTVIEIGPGAGALTAALCQKAKRVICFEIDKELESVLAENLKDYDNVQVIFKDVMKVDMSEIEALAGEQFKLVANLPYYITTPIIFKFLEESDKIKTLAIMVQKEVAQKIVATPKDEGYGVLSVMTNFYADTKICRIVGRKMFFPAPKVDSAIVRLDIKQNEHSKEFAAKFKQIVFASFSMRRKTLLNNLSTSLHISKEEVTQKLLSLGINPSARAETLDVEDFVRLVDAF